MQFKDGCRVLTASGQDVGKIDRVVINPRTKAVTHVVVRKGLLLTEDKVVPIGAVASATPDRVVLFQSADNLDRFPPFEETHYVPVNSDAVGVDYQTGYARPLYISTDFIGETERNIPENTVALKEGAEVISADGESVGTVEV